MQPEKNKIRIQKGIEQPVNQKHMLAFLSISEPSIIKLRKSGKIPFLSVGGKIMYQPSKVIAALTNNQSSL